MLLRGYMRILVLLLFVFVCNVSLYSQNNNKQNNNTQNNNSNNTNNTQTQTNETTNPLLSKTTKNL